MDNLCWFLDYEVDVNCLDENFCIVLVSFFYICLLGFFFVEKFSYWIYRVLRSNIIICFVLC